MTGNHEYCNDYHCAGDCGLPHNQQERIMNFKINSDRTVAVSTDTFWKPIDENTPIGVKMQLINKLYGVAIMGTYGGPSDHSFTHWHPLPKFLVGV